MKQMIRSFGRMACFMWLCLGMAAGAFAAGEIGMVMNMEGSMTAKGTDGALRVLKIFAKVLPGDILFMGKDSYARIKFADGAQITLQPGAQFKIEDYHFDAQQPDKDRAGFNLVKGGLRAVSGLIGKRGDQDSYSVKAQTATVGIRGTHFGMLLCKSDCGSISTPEGKPPENGLHLDVAEGAVILRNAGATQLFNAGQFGFVRDTSTPPVTVPTERAVKVEVPAKIFLDRVRGTTGEKKNDQGKAAGADAKSVDPKAAKQGDAKAGKAKPDEGEPGAEAGGEAGDKSDGESGDEAGDESGAGSGDEPGTESGGGESGGGESGGGESGGTVCPI